MDMETRDTFATIAVPSSITKNVNTTKSRQLHDMRPPFSAYNRIDVTSSGAKSPRPEHRRGDQGQKVTRLWKPDLNSMDERPVTEPRCGQDRALQFLRGGATGGYKMPDAMFVLGAGAGFFLAMYQWVTMIAETLP